MHSYRLRTELPDRPGALAALTRSLAAAGCDVLRVDVHGVDGRVAVDELSVLAPSAVTADRLRRLVGAAGARAVVVAPLAVESDVDPVAGAFRLAGEVGTAADAADRVRVAERGLARLLDAAGAWILPAPDVGAWFGHEATSSPTVVTRATVGGTGRAPTATLALLPHGGHVGVALRWGRWSYTSSELARADALVSLAVGPEDPAALPGGTGTAATAAGTRAPAPTAGVATSRRGPVPAVVRPLAPTDATDLLDLDLRLSDRTRRLRFNGARGLPTGAELRQLTTPTADLVAVGAWTDRGMAGVAHAVRCPDDPATAELAVVVVDAEQRRGVGTRLLRRLVREADAHGLRRLVARTAPHNDAIRRLLGGLSPSTITRIAHGEVEVQVDVRALVGDGGIRSGGAAGA